MDEECLNLDLPNQGSATALAGSRLGRARHSVRAGVVNQDAWVGNHGGQKTARPTRRGAKVKPERRNRTGVAREIWHNFSTRSVLSLPFYAMARSGIWVPINPDS